ncbi:hypothetical protein [Embleya sp. NPDC005971]|uniref:hypothetical protein n=1 Tax=Embleya sp. NPDC005971 TaxID=3156724 RepID=UPI003404EA63
METAGEFAPATDTGPADRALAGRLFHFTDRAGWEGIRRDGVIKARSKVAAAMEDPERLVVWLTDLDDPRASGRTDDFAHVRLTVPAHPDVRYWPALVPTISVASTLNTTPGSVPDSWYCCLGNLPLGGVVAHTIRLDGTWPDPPGFDAADAFGPAPGLADLDAWRRRCRAALDRAVTTDVDDVDDVVLAAVVRFPKLNELFDELRASDPDGMRVRAAWRSADDVARVLGAGT